MLNTIIMYAVRVKNTNKYLPRSQRRDGRGGSHLEPVDFSDRSTWPPKYEKNMQIRSYTTRVAAENLLRCWCQGKYSVTRHGWDEDYSEETYLMKGTARDPNTMEVVPITIHLPS